MSFVGQGKRNYIGNGETPRNSGYGCKKTFDYEAMDYLYQNTKDPNQMLAFTIIQGDFGSEFNIYIKKKYDTDTWYRGNTANFFNPGFSALVQTKINDTINKLLKTLIPG